MTTVRLWLLRDVETAELLHCGWEFDGAEAGLDDNELGDRLRTSQSARFASQQSPGQRKWITVAQFLAMFFGLIPVVTTWMLADSTGLAFALTAVYLVGGILIVANLLRERSSGR